MVAQSTTYAKNTQPEKHLRLRTRVQSTLSWAAPGSSWGASGSSWGASGSSWVALGSSWAAPGSSWAAPEYQNVTNMGPQNHKTLNVSAYDSI